MALAALKKMTHIETVEDMNKWAADVNHGLSLSEKCDYQDIWGHSNYNLMVKLFCNEKADRKLITHALFVTMSYEEVERMLLAYARAKAQNIIDQEVEDATKDANDKWNKAAMKEMECKEKERLFLQNEKTYQDRIENLTRAMDAMNDTAQRVNAEYVTMKPKAEAYDTIRSLLNL